MTTKAKRFSPQRAKFFRKKRGMTHLQVERELFKMMGEAAPTRQSIWAWESGKNSPSADNLSALAAVYNISIEELMQ